MGLVDAEGVLIAGVYGSGKSSVAAEIAYLLQEQEERFALLDLDYLGWASTGEDEHVITTPTRLRNLAAIVSNYREVGIRWYVLAGFVRDRAELERLRQVLDMPVKVARLEVPMQEIERRLASDVTTERRDDLRVAAAAIAASEGVGLEDLVVANERPVSLVAHEILDWLGWP